MTKLLTLAAGFALLTTAATAQTLSIGPTLSAGHSYTGNVPAFGAHRDFKLSAALGVGAVWSSNVHWGLGFGAQVSHEGNQWEYNMPGGLVYDEVISPVYIRVPVNFIYFFGDGSKSLRPKIYAGFSGAVKVDEAYDFSINEQGNGSETVQTAGKTFDRWDYGPQAGLGFNLKLMKNTWLNVDGSYYYGLRDVTRGLNDGWNNNQNLRANVGLMWGI